MPWLICAIASFAVFYQFLLQVSTSVMIPELMQAFSIEIIDIGILSASFFYTYLILQIPSGLLIDRIGAKLTLSIGVLICSLGCILFALSDYIAMAQISRLIMGAAAAPAVACALYLIGKWLPARYFALAVGLMEMTGMLGAGIGEPLLGKGVDAALGWRGTMLLAGSAGLILTLTIILLVKDAPTPSISHVKRKIFEDLLLILKRPIAWASGLYASCIFAMIGGFASLWAIPFIQTVYHVNITVASTTSAMVFLGAAVGAPLAGWFSDLIKSRRLTMLLWTLPGFVVSLLVFYTPPTSLTVFSALLFLLGFCCGSYVIPFAIMKETMSPDIRGAAMGYTNMMCILLGAPILQPLTAWLLSLSANTHIAATQVFTIQDYQFALIGFPVCILLALLSICFIKETYTVKNDYTTTENFDVQHS